jgi:hypothetical protein
MNMIKTAWILNSAILATMLYLYTTYDTSVAYNFVDADAINAAVREALK